jgi:hypothetical protein
MDLSKAHSKAGGEVAGSGNVRSMVSPMAPGETETG